MALDPDQQLTAALAHHRAGRLSEAEALYRRILAQDPHSVGALYYLGVIALQVGRCDAAIELIRVAAERAPQIAEIQVNLGEAYRLSRRPTEAAACFERALTLEPGNAAAHSNLGIVLKENGRVDEAIGHFQRAIALRPDYAEAYNNLGSVFHDRGQLDEALGCYERAVVLRPDLPHVHSNLGNLYKELGRLDEALAEYRKSWQIDPRFKEAHSCYVYTLSFHPGYDAEAIYREARHWADCHAAGLKPVDVRPRAPESTGRRLRIGYVSPDFRDHAECFFVMPLLEAHDREHYEIHAYSSVSKPDSITRRFQRAVDRWHDVASLNDQQLAEKIAADGIDILVDLTMHMADHRLLVFARKPAPIQVTWLAYPGTTGVTAIDYRFTDAYMEPPGSGDRFSAEIPVRLPDSWCCYDPVKEYPPCSEPPVLRTGKVTFGSLNNFCKINDAVLTCWAKVLAAVPDASLVMLCPSGSARRRVCAKLDEAGIEASRIEFVGFQSRQEYLSTYGRIDIALDPFPYNGITTTLDALWMGVPVLTLAGTLPQARAGLSILTTLGCPEWVAASEAEFVVRASDLAMDGERLASLRRSLREQMQRSTLTDGPRFARHVEAAYRKMWSAYVSSFSG